MHEHGNERFTRRRNESMSSQISRVVLVLLSIATVAGGCGGGSASGGMGGGAGATTAGAAGNTGRGGAAGATGVAGSVARGGTTGSAGASGAAGSTSDGGVLPVGDLGKGCATNSDCTGGLTCAAPGSTVFGAGGPANGFCTKSCADADAGDVCGALNAVCVNMSTDATPAPF